MIELPNNVAKFFWYFIKKRPLAFFVFFLVPCTIILETNVIPYSLKLIIDAVVDDNSDKNAILKKIQPAFWIAATAWCSLIIITRLQNWWEAYIIPEFEADIRMSVLKHVMHHSHNFFANELSGSISNKINDLPRSVESIRGILCWNGISAIAVISASLTMMASINLLFSFIIGIWIIVHTIVSLYGVRCIKNNSERNSHDKSELNGNIIDVITNINSVKLFSNQKYEYKFIGKKQLKEQLSHKKFIINLNIFKLIMDASVTTMLGTIFYFLILEWKKGKITPGDWVLTFNILFAVLKQIWDIGHILTDLFREVGTAQQALSIIKKLPRMSDSIGANVLQVNNGEIIFKNVNFNHVNRKKLFNNFSITIKSGEKIGLVGRSGSGKSTFINLILRFFEIKSGTITIDGQNIYDVTQNSICEKIAVIPQDPCIFHRSVMENIRYGKFDATDEEVILASKKSYCDEFISELPESYDSLVGERGVNLSTGQRQRIAIARALLKNAPILILDEATSALDVITEGNIQNALYNLIQNRTTIVIAHRLSTLSKMDRIIVFDNGRIIEDGTHSELLNLNGSYKNMWQKQIDGFLCA